MSSFAAGTEQFALHPIKHFSRYTETIVGHIYAFCRPTSFDASDTPKGATESAQIYSLGFV